MENKKSYLLIGEICGLRKAVAEMEKRVNFLEGKLSSMKERPYDDDLIYGEESGVGYSLREAKSAFASLGDKYGKFKCWFRHNQSEEMNKELKRAIKVVELELVGDSEANLNKLIRALDVMASEALTDWQQVIATYNFQKSHASVNEASFSMSFFEKSFKSEFMKTHKSKIDSLNVYLERHRKKQISKEKFPRKAQAISDFFLNLKKELENTKEKVLVLKA